MNLAYRHLIGCALALATLDANSWGGLINVGTPQSVKVVSPDVGTDGRVTFRLYAPAATKVDVVHFAPSPSQGGRDDAITLPMTRQGDVWTATSAALLLAAPGRQQQPPTVFQGGVDLVTIDVQITPGGKATGPMRVLTPADFEITISGEKRAATTVTFLHDDTGPVLHPFPLPTPGASPACGFGFFRKIDRPTAHYLVAVQTTAADRKQVKDVKLKVVDKAFSVEQYAWRSPIRGGGS